MTYYEYWLKSIVNKNLLLELKISIIKPLVNNKFKLKLFFEVLLRQQNDNYLAVNS